MNVTVAKIGGSLLSHPKKLRNLCAKLSMVSKKHSLIVVPGGGEFADVVRNLDKKFSLSCSVSHHMAILGMDQYGLLLSDLIPNSKIVREFKDIKYFLDSCNLSVFLPSKIMFNEDPLENSWNVTSDSIAFYVATRLQATKVLFVTDVDGVYTSDPNKNSDAKLIKNLSAIELYSINSFTSVDIFLPKLLLKTPIDCFLVNGLFPERVEAVLEGSDTVSTIIRG